MVNQRFSFKDYSFLVWVEKNKESIKWILSAFITVSAIGTGKWSVLIGALAKFTLDGIDYWLKE